MNILCSSIKKPVDLESTLPRMILAHYNIVIPPDNAKWRTSSMKPFILKFLKNIFFMFPNILKKSHYICVKFEEGIICSESYRKKRQDNDFENDEQYVHCSLLELHEFVF